MSMRAVFLGVVLPFLALSALGLWLTREQPSPAPTPVAEPPAPVRLPAPAVPEAPVTSPLTPPVRPPVTSPLTPPGGGPPVTSPLTPPGAGPPEPTPEEQEEQALDSLPLRAQEREDLRGALRSLRPLVQQCFGDVASRYAGRLSVQVRFTLEPGPHQGRFLQGALLHSSIPDPHFHACVLDSLLDAHPVSPRSGPLTATHTFFFEGRLRR